MIYTVKLNPAIDYIVRLDHVETGAVNRMASEDKFAGGKGINVSRVLKRLDIENTATGFIVGFTGRFIDSIHSKKGLVKIQLTDLIERDPSDTSICRRFYLPTDDDRRNISLDQLGRMVTNRRVLFRSDRKSVV